jgi:hypothetical protein
VKIHAVQTGTVQVHERQRSGEGRGIVRFARTLLDRRWTEPLPINAWIIEHSEGLIVVDTGETARTAEPRYKEETGQVAVRQAGHREPLCQAWTCTAPAAGGEG